ncbi:SLC13 family permease [Neisseria weixii]|uniref:SLC13 family permease n=1 Tax=Neisseria weixii TaxID=1853276 RepID=UPI00360F9AB2
MGARAAGYAARRRLEPQRAGDRRAATRQHRAQTIGRLKFKVGDILLLVPRKDIDDFRRDSAFIVLAEGEKPMPNNWRAPFSIFVMLAVVTVAAFEWAHISMTSMMGAVAMVAAGCLSAEAAYKAINWRIIILLALLAGLLPLGLAMTETGAAQYVVDHTVGLVKDSGPLLALGALYLVTKLLTEFMSNSGVAVLFAPIAISTAKMLGVNPEPFLIG